MSIKNTETLMQVLSTCMTSGSLKCFQVFRTSDLLCLVYFKKIEFQEFSFLIFPCLGIIWKVSQKKVNSGQQINYFYPQESVFLSLSKGKHFSLWIKHIFPSSENSWKNYNKKNLDIIYLLLVPKKTISMYLYLLRKQSIIVG